MHSVRTDAAYLMAMSAIITDALQEQLLNLTTPTLEKRVIPVDCKSRSQCEIYQGKSLVTGMPIGFAGFLGPTA
jgi:hypothetical protein